MIIKTYKQLLIKEIKKHKIKLKFSKKKDSTWNRYRNTITINSKQKLDLQVCCLIHELGHAYNDLYVFSGKFNKKGDKICQKMNLQKQLTKEENLFVYEEEKLAWKRGSEIAIDLGITFGPGFYKVIKVCLNTYKKI